MEKLKINTTTLLIGALIFSMFIIGSLFSRAQNSRTHNTYKQNTIPVTTKDTPTRNVKVPDTVPSMPKTKDPYAFFSKVGKDIVDTSNVSITKNADGSIDVLNTIQNEPEVIVESAFEASTRKWILEFMKAAYTSEFDVRYVQVGVTWLYADVSPTQVGLGKNQASKLTKQKWETIAPGEFCDWVRNVSIGKNDTNPSSSTYAKNFVCR